MDWYHLLVTGDEVAAGKVEEYKGAFQQAFAAAQGPRTMALFQRESGEGGVELYFTPEAGKHAAGLMNGWGCTPCDRPSLIALHLLVGHNEITYYMP